MFCIQLWAIMLNKCNENFAVQCGARKFLDVIEEVITSNQRQTPLVRDRLLGALAGATYASLQRTSYIFRPLKCPYDSNRAERRKEAREGWIPGSLAQSEAARNARSRDSVRH
jgi:hypothetical protein